MGKRGRACRGDRRGVVHRGRGLANRLARRSEAGAETARLRRGFRREKAPQIRRERFTAGSTETARRARQTARVDRETRVRGRFRGVSREYPPEPARARSHREGLPVPVGRFERHFSERARHVGTERYFFEQAGGGGRTGRARGPVPRPRARDLPRPSSKIVSARPRSRRRVRSRVSPRTSRASRVPAFSLTAPVPRSTVPIAAIVPRSTRRAPIGSPVKFPAGLERNAAELSRAPVFIGSRIY